MNPRMKRKYPQQWEPRDLVVTIPFLVEDRIRLTSLHHETDRICRRHPRDLHKQAKRAWNKPPKAFPKRRGQKDQGLGTETRGSVAEILRKLKLQEGATSSRSPPGSGLLPTGRPEPFSRKKKHRGGDGLQQPKGLRNSPLQERGIQLPRTKESTPRSRISPVESPAFDENREWIRHVEKQKI
ncbi:hypothetical protein CKAN_02777500 [Cinnamomum micranthum f. kanehirae]|uniref:Uncharacterized protein n=1 Tax=Cinnamomum micranthum f. kanehirae TaxID=337451 RepID=A0A443Q5G5_9MAGN|nr:hypothetical protein CKAN_02777500 [Cinnamomum micranthum f. kanehirae]